MAEHIPFKEQHRVPLAGSEKASIATVPTSVAAHITPAPTDTITVTVVLKPKEPIETTQRMGHEELVAAHGPKEASVNVLKAFAEEFGLSLKAHATAGPRSFSVSGTMEQLSDAFGVALSSHELNGQTLRVREGTINLPEELEPHVLAVLGLDNRPQAQPHFRRSQSKVKSVSYTPVQVAQLYGAAANASAAGQTIGIIELGGGFPQSDIQSYFQSLNLPVPAVTAVLVDGGTNSPTDPSGADSEVLLDIEVSGAVAPGANIAVYFAPNTDQGFIDAISSALHDTTNKPSVVSISWGGPESTWTAQSVSALNTTCQAAAALGITITVAAGDNGSSDGVTDGANHVDFPGSSPNVLCCGGTTLVASGNTIQSEVVWNENASNEGATGGGVSDLFPLPTWQQGFNVPAPTTSTGGRGVPDVAGDADPTTGYSILVDGQSEVIGGTSAVAPLWAGIIALANAQNATQSKPTVGFVNTTLYANPSAFNDITSGKNGAFSAGPGWDPCSGLGSPIVPDILAAVTGATTPAPTPTPTPTPTPPPTPTPTPTPIPTPTPEPPPHKHKHHHHESEDEADDL